MDILIDGYIDARRGRDLHSRLYGGPMRNQRGSVLVFTMIVLVFLWIVAGTLGYDVAHLVSDRGELQTSLDAAALAGAGKLGFDNTAFPAARDFAVMFA